VEEAARIANERGFEQLTLAAVATDLGVRTPSLYKHVDGLPELRRRLAVRAKRHLGHVLSRACVGRSRGEALWAMAQAYREWAGEHPAESAAAQVAPVPEDRADVDASTLVTDVVFEVLSGYGADEETVLDATRTLRAGMHGFAVLEAAGGFGMDRPVEASFDWWLGTLDAALTAVGQARSHQTKS
jgi:AcrR family transcriptional regulator